MTAWTGFPAACKPPRFQSRGEKFGLEMSAEILNAEGAGLSNCSCESETLVPAPALVPNTARRDFLPSHRICSTINAGVLEKRFVEQPLRRRGVLNRVVEASATTAPLIEDVVLNLLRPKLIAAGATPMTRTSPLLQGIPARESTTPKWAPEPIALRKE
jgi:hypothetical protein